MPRARPSRIASVVRRVVGMQALDRRLDAVEKALRTIETGPVYLGDHTALVATQWGGILLVDTRDTTLSPALLLNRLWEPPTTKWFEETLHGGQVFLDVGANIGYFSLLARRLVGDDGRVIAVEAHPHLTDLLRRNMILNGFRNVTVWHRAAWSGSTELEMHTRTHFVANSSIGSLGDDQLAVHADTEQVVKVQADSLDELVADVPRIDVVKVDVEGSELRVFSGLTRTFERNPHIAVMFEWSPGQLAMLGDDPKDLVDLLTDYGFRFRLMDDGLADVDASRLLDIPFSNVVATR
ncbi:MAG: FkbM family methyltransferase [Nitrososphaerales archaeon]